MANFLKKLLKVELSEESIQLKKELTDSDYSMLKHVLKLYKSDDITEKTVHDYISVLINATKNKNYNK
jgi:hypothetical protein